MFNIEEQACGAAQRCDRQIDRQTEEGRVVSHLQEWDAGRATRHNLATVTGVRGVAWRGCAHHHHHHQPTPRSTLAASLSPLNRTT